MRLIVVDDDRLVVDSLKITINLFVQQMKISYYRALKRHIFHI